MEADGPPVVGRPSAGVPMAPPGVAVPKVPMEEPLRMANVASRPARLTDGPYLDT